MNLLFGEIFMLIDIFKYLFPRRNEYVFAHNKVFRHACSTPLTILISNLETQINSQGQTIEKELAKTSFEAVKKLSKLIEFMSDSDLKNEKFQIYEAINEVLILMRGKVDCSCFSSSLLINKDLFLIGNKLYFQEALTCLFNNSIEAYSEIEQKPISLVVRKLGDDLRIDAIDYASGMNYFLQRMVLINGVSTKNKGTGLGLSFAKHTFENIFSGKMNIKSFVGLGTHIVCTIPLKKPYNQNLLQS